MGENPFHSCYNAQRHQTFLPLLELITVSAWRACHRN